MKDLFDRVPPVALNIWKKLPTGLREKYLNNYECAACGKSSAIENFNLELWDKDLAVRGHCSSCGKEVLRICALPEHIIPRPNLKLMRSWQTDVRHMFPAGTPIKALHPKMREKAAVWAAIVRLVRENPTEDLWDSTDIVCFGRIERIRCGHSLLVMLSEDKESIGWWCETCGENGDLYGWQEITLPISL